MPVRKSKRQRAQPAEQAMADIDSFVAHGAPPPSAATELREEEHGQQRTAMADLHAFVRAGELVDLPGGGGLRFARPAEQPDRG